MKKKKQIVSIDELVQSYSKKPEEHGASIPESTGEDQTRRTTRQAPIRSAPAPRVTPRRETLQARKLRELARSPEVEAKMIALQRKHSRAELAKLALSDILLDGDDEHWAGHDIVFVDFRGFYSHERHGDGFVPLSPGGWRRWNEGG